MSVPTPQEAVREPAIDPLPGAGMPSGRLGVGLLGCGVVGSAVARALVADADRFEAATGRRPSVEAVAVRHVGKRRDVPVDPGRFTDDPAAVVEHPGVDVIVEAIGGVNPAGGLLELALERGTPAVTVNKELLARRWRCLGEAAADGRLLFEGSVMAGVPVLGPLGGLASGDHVRRLEGILNGTTNYCLHRMEEAGVSLGRALGEARKLGYTELDPSADVDGKDAAAKLAILSSVGFGRAVTLADVEFAGIGGIEPRALLEARGAGEAIRLVAEAWRVGDEVIAHVAPRRLSSGHPLARVPDAENALLVETTLAGTLLFQGPGAGGERTASAVLSDLARIARRVRVAT